MDIPTRAYSDLPLTLLGLSTYCSPLNAIPSEPSILLSHLCSAIETKTCTISLSSIASRLPQAVSALSVINIYSSSLSLFSPFLWPLPTGSDAILRLLRAITGSRVGSPAKQGRHHTTLRRKATGEERREVGGAKGGKKNEANEGGKTVWGCQSRWWVRRKYSDKS